MINSFISIFRRSQLIVDTLHFTTLYFTASSLFTVHIICILYCFTDVNQDDSPKSLRLENSQMVQMQSTAHKESLRGSKLSRKKVILLHWMTWIYPPRMQSSPPGWHDIFRIENQRIPTTFATSQTSKRITFSSRHQWCFFTFPEVFVGGWPGLLSDVPATFQWVLRATASTLEMGMALGEMTFNLSAKIPLWNLWIFNLFWTQKKTIWFSDSRGWSPIFHILTADGVHCVRALPSSLMWTMDTTTMYVSTAYFPLNWLNLQLKLQLKLYSHKRDRYQSRVLTPTWCALWITLTLMAHGSSFIRYWQYREQGKTSQDWNLWFSPAKEDRRLNVTTTTYFAAVKKWKDRQVAGVKHFAEETRWMFDVSSCKNTRLWIMRKYTASQHVTILFNHSWHFLRVLAIWVFQEMSVNLDLPTSISECQKSVGFWALLYCSVPLVGSQVVGDDQGPTKKWSYFLEPCILAGFWCKIPWFLRSMMLGFWQVLFWTVPPLASRPQILKMGYARWMEKIL